MTIDLKIKALELASQHTGEKPLDIIERANHYHRFLSGTAAAPVGGAGTATAGAKPATPPAGGKPATPPAGGKPATTKAAAPPAGGKPATPPAGAKAAGTAQKPGANPSPTNDTKDPKGKHTFGDVCAKLKELMIAKNDPADPNTGKNAAMAVLKAAGGGVDSVRNLKPALYDKVVTAVAAALVESDPTEMTGDGEEAGFETGVEAPELDEMGLPVD